MAVSKKEIVMSLFLALSIFLTWQTGKQRDRYKLWAYAQEVRGDVILEELRRLQDTLQCEVPE